MQTSRCTTTRMLAAGPMCCPANGRPHDRPSWLRDTVAFGLTISTGLIRRADGGFGVYAFLSIEGRDDVEPVRRILADESGSPVCFATESEAEIAAFDWV